jgi:hypothetical protein
MACALALPLVVALAGPASAHASETITYFGRGGVSSDHTRAYACDSRDDGNVVFTEYSRGDSRAVYDYNHTSSGCGWASVGFCITSYRVCMAVTGGKICSGWQST